MTGESPTTLMRLLDALYRAASERRLARVRELLLQAGATRIPRDVREDALVLARSPIGSMRAPIALLRYRFMLEQLELGHALVAVDQLELSFPGARHAARGRGDEADSLAEPVDPLREAS
jgi:hypothetical protein